MSRIKKIKSERKISWQLRIDWQLTVVLLLKLETWNAGKWKHRVMSGNSKLETENHEVQIPLFLNYVEVLNYYFL